MTLSIALHGKTALVTGGAGGIGASCAAMLMDCGAQVILADLPGERLAKAETELSSHGDVAALAADLSLPEVCRDLPRAACETAGADLDIVVNAVGVMHTRPFTDVGIVEWQQTMDVNLTGVFHTINGAASRMSEASGGSIVTLSSVAGRSGRPNAVDYSATKTALLSVTKSAAMAFAPRVRINAVCPGVVMTDMWAAILADRDREFGSGAGQQYLDEVAARTPMRRLGGADEVAKTVVFLASDLSSFITGQAINVDGGLEMD